MAKNPVLPGKSSVKPRGRGNGQSTKLSNHDADGNQIFNEVLLSLPEEEREALFPRLEFVRLLVHQVLHEPGDSLRSAYFCNSGLISILSVFPDGKSVEVGLVGKEGLVGLPLIAGFQTSATRAIVQIDATAFRIDGTALMEIVRKHRMLDLRLQQVAQIMAMELTQVAACNRLHEVSERLARWLLMSADRIGSNEVPLTQELLAQMLGTRRASVTVAAGMLQKAALIGYTRGDVSIIDRQGLEEAACECYGLMQQQIKEWTEGSK
jgi:CRP-like cAMP-binding protein